MLLTELVPRRPAKISAFNRYLKECYGYSINPGVSTGQLKSLYTKIADDLYNLKLDGFTPRDSEYARKLVVHEGIRELLRQRTLTEARMGPGADVFNRVCSKLGQYVCDCVNTGDSEDHAIGKAMDAYRSSRYRFPDSDVEMELREVIRQTFECGDDHLEPQRDTLMDWEEEQQGASADEVEQAIRWRIMRQHPEVIGSTDENTLSYAIRDIADFHAGTTEMGSSDISGMVRQVLAQLNLNESYATAEDLEADLLIYFQDRGYDREMKSDAFVDALEHVTELHKGSYQMGNVDIEYLADEVKSHMEMNETTAGAIAH